MCVRVYIYIYIYIEIKMFNTPNSCVRDPCKSGESSHLNNVQK